MHLFLKTTLTFREVAELIGRRILVEFEVQERDGLNLGGGNYFLFTCDDAEVVLVCNDAAHTDVFQPEHAEYPYYCYVYRGSQTILSRIMAALPMSDLQGSLVDES